MHVDHTREEAVRKGVTWNFVDYRRCVFSWTRIPGSRPETVQPGSVHQRFGMGAR
jgi:hypothetical protein